MPDALIKYAAGSLWQPRCAAVRPGESAAVQGLPEGAAAAVQRAEGAGEEAPEENLRAPPRVQQQVQEDDQAMQQEQVDAFVPYSYHCYYYYYYFVPSITVSRLSSSQKSIFGERERRAPAAAERRAAAAAPGAEAGTVLQSEVPAEGTHQDGKLRMTGGEKNSRTFIPAVGFCIVFFRQLQVKSVKIKLSLQKSSI